MSASLSRHSETAVLPSLPPSPSLLDEVFGHPGPWNTHHEEFDLQSSRPSSPVSAGIHAKEKGKQTTEVEDDEDDEEAEHHTATHDAYPPRNDESAETQRVQETLKRWELADRKRRKSARESVQYTSGPSFLSSIARKATLVLSGRTPIGTSIGSGGARTFKSHETVNVAREGYAVPLDDIDHARTSPSPSSFERNVSLDTATGMTTGSGTSENPFVHPSERTRTPASLLSPITPTPMLPPSNPPSPSSSRNTHTRQAVHRDVTTRVSAESRTDSRKRSVSSRTPVVLPPRPLGLPEDTRHTTQLQSTTPPILQAPPRESLEEREEAWWWHEWLCGCGEGPDRGGDNQAGRTNPFE